MTTEPSILFCLLLFSTERHCFWKLECCFLAAGRWAALQHELQPHQSHLASRDLRSRKQCKGNVPLFMRLGCRCLSEPWKYVWWGSLSQPLYCWGPRWLTVRGWDVMCTVGCFSALGVYPSLPVVSTQILSETLHAKSFVLENESPLLFRWERDFVIG